MMKNGGRPPRPAWRRLYAVLFLVVVMYLVALMAAPTPEQVRWLDLLLLLSFFGAMWAWVRANRAAIQRRDEQRKPGGTDVTQVIPFPSPQPSHYSFGSRTPRALKADHLVNLVTKN
jgi:hypothetical protein